MHLLFFLISLGPVHKTNLSQARCFSSAYKLKMNPLQEKQTKPFNQGQYFRKQE